MKHRWVWPRSLKFAAKKCLPGEKVLAILKFKNVSLSQVSLSTLLYRGKKHVKERIVVCKVWKSQNASINL